MCKNFFDELEQNCIDGIIHIKAWVRLFDKKHTGKNPGFDHVLIEDVVLEDIVLEDVVLEDVLLEDVY